MATIKAYYNYVNETKNVYILTINVQKEKSKLDNELFNEFLSEKATEIINKYSHRNAIHIFYHDDGNNYLISKTKHR
jgi:cell division protein ZapA (FtsZ GTPase activity inhibitor)